MKETTIDRSLGGLCLVLVALIIFLVNWAYSDGVNPDSVRVVEWSTYILAAVSAIVWLVLAAATAEAQSGMRKIVRLVVLTLALFLIAALLFAGALTGIMFSPL